MNQSSCVLQHLLNLGPNSHSIVPHFCPGNHPLQHLRQTRPPVPHYIVGYDSIDYVNVRTYSV
jgi:hypothetical protein